jgi:hypothetical protein
VSAPAIDHIARFEEDSNSLDQVVDPLSRGLLPLFQRGNSIN